MDVVVDTVGSYLLDIAVKSIENSFNGSTVELELIFEEHSGIPGDSVFLKMSGESIQRLKELL